jgi:hypothetical protein
MFTKIVLWTIAFYSPVKYLGVGRIAPIRGSITLGFKILGLNNKKVTQRR